MSKARPVAVMVVGALLIAACGAAPAAPEPTAAPAGTASRTPASPASPASTSPSPVATGAVAASAEWTAVGGARLSGGTALLDVAATGPRDAWAVGYQDSAEDREGTPAVLRWNGSRWREIPLGQEAGAHHLEAVGAAGPDDVWVAGNGPSAFAAHWNGRAWAPHRPFGVAEDYRLADVSTGGGDTWFAANGPSGAVVLEWAGGEFRNVLTTGGTFEAITSGEGHVWAVGTSETRTPLVWHGTAGSWESLETPPIPGGRLSGVWQVSPSEVWAVGQVSATPEARPDARAGGEGARPLVVRWDGTRWTRVEVPVSRGSLHGVTASGPGDLWISGVDADHAGQVLILHFDGTTWSREYGPLFRAYTTTQQYDETDDVGGTVLTRVPGSGALWAVGSVGVGDDEKAFVLRRWGS
ncbi:hypothetical protein OG339_08050 [Streptosporangium sp. NBC_01495]|uniref:hypothetical protein n=1 Tax=Streptosporangium sp. NBC_01495 TaxID=2903899 RepID=UPI002E2F477D|nr:hypothetical protein [Streptosporangium sp. NBC_01495]